jgi:hypothetical protein
MKSKLDMGQSRFLAIPILYAGSAVAEDVSTYFVSRPERLGSGAPGRSVRLGGGAPGRPMRLVGGAPDRTEKQRSYDSIESYWDDRCNIKAALP